MAEGKRGQIFIIAAVVIVFILAGLAAVSNYVYVKKQPQKFYELSDVLQLEGLKVIEYSEYSRKSVDDNIGGYLTAFKDYMQVNTHEDFNLIIFYGNAESGTVTARIFSRSSLEESGGVSISLGSSPPFEVDAGSIINFREEQVIMNPSLPGALGRTVNITIISERANITQTLPLLQDNNFVFVMTTSEGFSQYIQTSLGQQNTQ